MSATNLGGVIFDWSTRVHVMGIVNVTPDSFSGDGTLDHGAAVDHGLGLAADGADILDVGGESTRPGHRPVEAAEELARILPVVRRLVLESGRPVSVDTWKLAVAEACAGAGASIINDIWGLQRSPEIAGLAAREGLGLVLMHNQVGCDYADLVPDVRRALERSCAQAEAAGVPPGKVIADPGIGFGKNGAQNLELLRRLSELRPLQRPLLVGTSRKSFIGDLLGLPADERLEGTAATVTAAVLRGAAIVRVHDVRAMIRVVRVAEMLR